MTGNGIWNLNTDFGESVVKLQYTPPSAPAADTSLNDPDAPSD